MRPFLSISKALSDENRVRALLALRGGELCLCQIVELLALAPSTVSRHMALLYHAGLVERRKQGRWHFYRLAGGGAPAEAREALRWTLKALAEDPAARRDAEALARIQQLDLEALCACYRG